MARLLAAAALLFAAHAGGQTMPKNLPHVGFCSIGQPEAELISHRHLFAQVLVNGLRDRGWVGGKNYQMIFRSAFGRAGGMGECIDVLLAVPVDVLVLPNTAAAKEALNRTTTIPIVAILGRPVEEGLAASLSRPPENLTGVSREDDVMLQTKRLELFKELGANHVVYVIPSKPSAGVTPGIAPFGAGLSSPMRTAAEELKLTLSRLIVTTPEQLDLGCAQLGREKRIALFVVDSPIWVQMGVDNMRGADFERCTIPSRLPAMASSGDGARARGVLLGYGPNFMDYLKRLPYFVDRVLRGAKPSELPIQKVEEFPLVVNAEVARKIGFTIPPSILLRADAVIQETVPMEVDKAKARY